MYQFCLESNLIHQTYEQHMNLFSENLTDLSINKERFDSIFEKAKLFLEILSTKEKERFFSKIKNQIFKKTEQTKILSRFQFDFSFCIHLEWAMIPDNYKEGSFPKNLYEWANKK